MKINIEIDSSTTPDQLYLLGNALRVMSGLITPTQDAEPTGNVATTLGAAIGGEPAATGAEQGQAAEAKTRKTRKAKEEPATPPADATPPAQEPGTQEQGAATPPADAGAGTVGTFTESEVQALATTVARAHGADVVKGKIAELGAGRIAEMKPEQLNGLGSYLQSIIDGTTVISK